jgi:L-aspartate oxidase
MVAGVRNRGLSIRYAASGGHKVLIKTDVLVVGAGIAGAVCALKAAQWGAEVVLLHQGVNADSKNTRWAQGGIIYTAEGDSPELLVEDIIRSGSGLTLPEAAEVLAREGPDHVREILIDELGVKFDRQLDGGFDITEEAAHAVPRILHCKDRTGFFINESLEEAIRAEPRITLLAPWLAIDLLTLDHHSRHKLDIYSRNECLGAYVLDKTSNRVETILARETVLATGGVGAVYLHTTNPEGARGDGIAMAYRARVRLLNLEYIQFHPTTFYHPHAQRFLISESMRGEGARLVRKNGTEFMNKYHEQGMLAPRDVVARAIHEELLADNDPCVYLDVSHKNADWIRQRFPMITEACRDLGVDITHEPIPVVPSAHYCCGGVWTDLHGRTTLKGLWAIGEVACTGLHGANRLASTSLLEGLVFGYRAARAMVQVLKDSSYSDGRQIDPWVDVHEPTDPALILQDWLTIKYTMWNYVGLVRSPRRLSRASRILRELQDEVEAFYAQTRLDDNLIGLRNGVQASLSILYAARRNHTSRGCHYLAKKDGGRMEHLESLT